MKWSTTFAVGLAMAGQSFGAAIEVRSTTEYSDADILNFALTLEHLEDKFYREGLANFTKAQFDAAGFGGRFYRNLQEISFDETTHVAFLSGALGTAGYPAVQECYYNFGINKTHPGAVEQFIRTASILEGVGITAYIGAAAYISTKAYLTAAASILSIEARHSSYLRDSLAQSPFPQPFDVPLDFNEVYTLASQFIVSCPRNNPPFLPLVSFPTLTVMGTAPFVTSSTITLTINRKTKDDQYLSKRQGNGYCTKNCPNIFAAWSALGTEIFVSAVALGNMQYEVVVPPGIHGQSYVVLTTSGSNVTDGTIVAGPAIVEVGGTTRDPAQGVVA